MGKFLEEEKPRQANFKITAPYFSEAAKADGIYKGHSYSFCLPQEFADENLFPEIRPTILAYFTRHKIKWHDGHNLNPSNHLCDSQVCCANFLFPFADKPIPLAALLRSIYPSISEMLPIEDDQYIAFEWIGQQNYLGEIETFNRQRTRGAHFTSADAAVMFRHLDGAKQIVMIEWKYSESYSGTSLEVAPSGRKRTDIYQRLFEDDNCPLAKELLPHFAALFFEPFYQLMRQQFLANEMEKAHELGADIVSVLHFSPSRNTDFKSITSPELQPLGNSAIDVWRRLVRKQGRFLGVSTEEIFGQFDANKYPEIKSWYEYITARYSWVKG